MTDGQRFEGSVSNWLADTAPPRAPERVLASALGRVAREGQARPLLARWLDAWAGAAPGVRWLLVILAFAALVGGVAIAGAVLERESPVPAGHSNGWIAYSTDSALPGSTDTTTGSDIYLVRQGVTPRLIAGRDGGRTRNVCPAFSPDGSTLAYGTVADGSLGIVLLGVDADGTTHPAGRIAIPQAWPSATHDSVAAPYVCARWSLDGTRLAYLDGRTVVVRGLDGSTQAPRPGDPQVVDFTSGGPYGADRVLSPSGDWTARLVSDGAGGCLLSLTNVRTAVTRAITPGFCGYAVAAWSPDAREVLVMEDVSGYDFTMHALAVDGSSSATVVSSVRIDGGRSWPQWGDVSWQSVLP